MVTNKVKTYALGFQNVLEPLGQLGHEVIWAADFSQFVADKSVIPCQIEQIDINTNANFNSGSMYQIRSFATTKLKFLSCRIIFICNCYEYIGTMSQ